MFLVVGDKKKDEAEGKYQLVQDDDEKSVQDEDGPHQLATSGKFFKKRDILHTILIGAAFFAFAWITMNMSKHHGLTSVEVEDQISKVTFATVNSTQTILGEAERRSTVLKRHHELIAANFLDTIAQDLTQSTNSSAQNFSQIIDETIHAISRELDLFETGVSDGFDGFVGIAMAEIEKIEASVAAENDDLALAKLTAEATDAITTLLQDARQMYSFYTKYLTSVLENKLLNTTDRFSRLLHAQRRFVAAKATERINLCYNVVTQNTKISRILKTLLDAMNTVGQTVDLINGLKSIREPSAHPVDAAAEHLVTESKSALAASMESSRRALDTLLEDDSCYLGTAVRKMAEQKHGAFKRAILQNTTAVVETLYTRWDALTANFKVVREAQRRRVTQELLKSAQILTDALEAKADRTGAKNGELDNLTATVSSLTEAFDKMAAEMNAVFGDSRKFTSESLHNYLRFGIRRQLARVSSLSIQNFIPDDLCPLAMNYQAYVSFTLNAALGRDVPDLVDELFTLSEVSSEELLDSREKDARPDNKQSEPSDDDAIRIMIVSVDDAAAENEGESAESGENGRTGDRSHGKDVEDLPPVLRNMLLSVFNDVKNVNGGTPDTEEKANAYIQVK